MPEIVVGRLTEYSDKAAAELGQIMPSLNEQFSGEPISEDLLQTIIDSPFHEQLIAQIDGKIVGAATMNLIMGPGAGKKGWLEDFVTDPEFRQRGIGNMVWQEMIVWCREQGIDFDFTSSSIREAAHRFYEKHGATTKDTTVFHKDVS